MGPIGTFVVLMIVVCLVRDGVPACYFSLIENDMRVMVVGWCENAVQGKSKRKRPLRWNECNGLSGADGSRNRDLFDALYQLSYSPVPCLKTTLNTIMQALPKRNFRAWNRRHSYGSSIRCVMTIQAVAV